jgi:hypothetical protein
MLPHDARAPLPGVMAHAAWGTDDDRLLCCLMTEFSENLALAADVYVSTRRLEGVHRDAANTEKRIRQIAQARRLLPRSRVGPLRLRCAGTDACLHRHSLTG